MKNLTSIFIFAVFLLVAYMALKSRAATKALRERQQQLRLEGIQRHPGVFDIEPIVSLEEVDSEIVSVFDMEMSKYIGRTSTTNVSWVVKRFSDIHEDMLPNGHNDIPFSIDDLLDMEEFAPTQPDESFIDLMRSATKENGYISLRWIVPAAK